ncbi:MAG: hypothetical protein Q8Q62_22060 [Mesorhizobium sp.]|nr:hypothetical protein [Mesorhizobium sp.]
MNVVRPSTAECCIRNAILVLQAPRTAARYNDAAAWLCRASASMQFDAPTGLQLILIDSGLREARTLI